MEYIRRNPRNFFYIFFVTVSILMYSVWFSGKFWSRDAEEKAAKIFELQRKTNDLFESREVRLFNKIISNLEWLGRFKPADPLLAH